MTPSEWQKIKYFKPSEFDSPDAPGSGEGMKLEFLLKLDELRKELGWPLKVVSGIRTAAHNAEVGGVDGSAHVAGFAADVWCRTSREREEILATAFIVGFKRIGIGQTFIHLDADPTKPTEVVWLY